MQYPIAEEKAPNMGAEEHKKNGMLPIPASLQGVQSLFPNSVVADLAFPAQSQLNHMAVLASDMTATN
jgi:hypothetical protein